MSDSITRDARVPVTPVDPGSPDPDDATDLLPPVAPNDPAAVDSGTKSSAPGNAVGASGPKASGARRKPSAGCEHLLLYVPDTVLWDPETLAAGVVEKASRGRPAACKPFLRAQMYRWLTVLARRPAIVVPDVLLAQLVWGARTAATPWPKRWRQKLRAVPFFKDKYLHDHDECPDACPVRGCGVPHGHFRLTVTSPAVFGRVARLGAEDDHSEPGLPRFDFTNPNGVKGLKAVYVLPLVFAASTRSRITPRQAIVLSHLVGQVTRTQARGLQTRPDKAQVFASTGSGLAADDPREYQLADCPLLTKGGRYVAFNGNRTRRMKNKPHGYGLKVRTRASLAGYPTASAYLKDLAALVPVFGLTAGGYDQHAKAWYSLDQMLALGEAGRDFLLRVYGPPGYREEWRAIFYSWLGFDPAHGGDHVASDADAAGTKARHRRKGENQADDATAPAARAWPRPDPAVLDWAFTASAVHFDTEARERGPGQEPSAWAAVIDHLRASPVVKFCAAVHFGQGPLAASLAAEAAAEYHAAPADWQACLAKLPNASKAERLRQALESLDGPGAARPESAG